MPLNLDIAKLGPADILDLAIYAEREARGHYEQIAAWLEARGSGDAAEFFRLMAGYEAKHQQQLEKLRSSRYADEPVRYTDAYAWEIEAPDYDQLELDDTSLVQAIDIALGSEDRAYEYYAEALQYVDDPETRTVLEQLRDAELGHRRMLEQQRQRLGG